MLDPLHDPLQDKAVVPQKCVEVLERQGWVRPIRCRDCKHKPIDNTNAMSCGGFDIEFPDEICPCQCTDGFYSWCPNDDWFCANGEPADDQTCGPDYCEIGGDKNDYAVQK